MGKGKGTLAYPRVRVRVNTVATRRFYTWASNKTKLDRGRKNDQLRKMEPLSLLFFLFCYLSIFACTTREIKPLTDWSECWVVPFCSFDQFFSICPYEQFGLIGCASTEAPSGNSIYPYPWPWIGQYLEDSVMEVLKICPVGRVFSTIRERIPVQPRPRHRFMYVVRHHPQSASII